MTTTEEGQKRLLRQKIDRDPACAFRVLDAIWNRQQPSEKETSKYAGSDGKGFQWAETEAANALWHRWIMAGKMWQKMSSIDTVRCQLMMKKYVSQYLSGEVDPRDRDIQRFKINKHKPRKKLSPEERQRIVDNIDRMEEQHGRKGAASSS